MTQRVAIGHCVTKKLRPCRTSDVRFAPKATELARRNKTPLCANSDQTQRSKIRAYSITLSAATSSPDGTAKPIDRR